MRLLTLLTAMALMVLMFASTAPAAAHLCSDHPNQRIAQAALDQNPSFAPTLDPDGDGVACEDFFGASFFGATASPPGSATASPTASATASPPATASPTAAALAATGGPPLVVPLTLVASLVLVGSGVAAVALVRRGAS